MSLARRFFKSSIFRTLETIINIMVGLFMLPFLITQLGESIYGIWILVGSITAAFYILDLGFASAVTRFISDALARNDRNEAQGVISTAWVVYLGLAVIICILTGIATVLVPIVSAPESPHGLIQLLIIITGLSLAIQFPVKAFAGIAAYHMRYDLLSISRIAFKLLSTSITIIAVIHGYGVVAVALAALVGDIFSNLTFRLIARYLEPKLTVRTNAVSRRHARELVSFSGWTLIIDTSRMLQERADIWVIGAFLSAQALTVYYVGLRLAAYSFELIMKAVSMNMPIFARDFANKDFKNMRKSLFLFSRLNCALAALAISAFSVTGVDLIKIWMGPEFETNAAYNVGLILLTAKMILFVSMPINAAFLAISKPKFISYISIFETLIMISTLIILIGVFKTGVEGAASAILISYSLFRPFVLPTLAAKELNFRILNYYTSLAPPLTLSILVGSTTYFISKNFEQLKDPYLILATKLSIFIFSTIILIPFFLKENEKNILKTALGPTYLILEWPKLVFKIFNRYY